MNAIPFPGLETRRERNYKMTLKETAQLLLRHSLDTPQADFRDGQWEAVHELVVARARLVLIQRTGWGKSVVYFLATRLLRDQNAGPTLLISPLLSLMRNQIEAAKRIGIRAATINSSNVAEWEEVKARLRNDEVDILLITPERLANERFRDNVLNAIMSGIGFLVVDEAHCISDWGHDFRPDYRRIVGIIQSLPATVPVLATTATANDRVIADIQKQFGSDFRTVCGSLTRESLCLQNIQLPDKAARYAWIAEHVPSLPGSGIIYTLTVRDARRLAEWLKRCNIDADAYYADLESTKRIELEDRLLDNRIKALAATTALGMGFDKPDLGFVIHFQRPGSIIHYYQQVGRAGRAVNRAYGILLSGSEDDEIIDYFIDTAFPLNFHISDVLAALNLESGGMTISQLEKAVNISWSNLEKVLKFLATETPPPVKKTGTKWYRIPIAYELDLRRVNEITRLRRAEQDRMREYMTSSRCLMQQLREELSDLKAEPCGQCRVCKGKPLISESYSIELREEAVKFLRRGYHTIEPRKRWPPEALPEYGFSGNIADELQFQPGRILSVWGDAGWGDLVREGKQVCGRFDDKLVKATAAMIIEHWLPLPFPAWLTFVPSLRAPFLVHDFARRLAKKLGVKFVECISKIKENQPQKGMQNSFQQAHNLDSVFTINAEKVLDKPVFLVDDMVDSKWTFTVLTALLRRAGSGDVHPLALAMTTSK